MPKLVVTVEDQLLSERPLYDKEVLIGRGPDCHIVVRDPLVSRHHAKIAKAYGGYFVEDLESTNGITVNGRRVRKQMLKYGDKIQIGTHDLCLIAEATDDWDKNDVNAEKTLVLGSPAALRWPIVHGQPQTPERGGRAHVRFLTGTVAGSSEPIEKSLYSIGEPGRKLAAISRCGQSYVLQHLGGARMTTLNGDPVPSGAGVKLKTGDRIQVGDTQLEFYLES